MTVDLHNTQHQNRFRRAVDWSRQQLAPFRKQREYIYRLLAGSRYGENNLDRSYPVPFLKLLHQTYLRALVASSPRCMISTRVPQLKPVARAMEIAINHRIKDSKLVEAVRTVVSDALICMGILKVGVCYYPQEGTTGLLHDYMKTYVDSISLDDWVHDMSAKRFDQVGYCGHRLRVPRQSLLNDPRLPADRIAELARSERWVYDEQGGDTVSALSSGRDTSNEGEHEDMIDLWEFWFPRDKLVALYPCRRGGMMVDGAPLWQTEYVGPELGPYHMLRFGELADNILPSPPVSDMADMHEALNGVYRKFLKRALNQKNIIPVPGGSDTDVDRINKTPDGHAVKVDGAAPPGEISYGANNEMNVLAIARMQSDSSYYSGGLESIAGLGPQSATLGQDQMLAASAGKAVQALQDLTVDFTRDVMRSLAWYWWNEPQTYNVEVPIEGFPGESVPTQITPEMREGYWLDLNFEINPYSLQSDTPGSRLNTIMEMLTKLLIPGAPLMMPQGVGINWQEVVREIGHLANIPNLENLLMFQTPPEVDELQEPPKYSPPNGGTYERVSRSEATPRGQNSAQMMAAMGAASSQQAGMAGVPQ